MDAQTLAEMNNMRIRIDERDGKIANQAVVITKLEQSRKDTKEDRKALLRVAKAAEKMANPILAYIQGSQYDKPIDELLEALKEVEHLLD